MIYSPSLAILDSLFLFPMENVTSTSEVCYHCGETNASKPISFDNKHFCCVGCKTVYEILNTNALCDYYALGEPTPGTSQRAKDQHQTFDWLDTPEISQKLINFSEGTYNKVTFYLPQIHCSSCIWLLENLPRLDEGIQHARVHFLRKELVVAFDSSSKKLSEVVALLSQIGYTPDLRLKDIQDNQVTPKSHRLIFQLGIAGFCFGNIMLLSFPEYLSINELTAEYTRFFGYLNILLSLPVFLYSAYDYYQSAWYSIKEQHLNIDVPISIGILTLFGRSVFEILTQTGAGYLDSLAALVFFLLIGKWFQEKTYHRLAFDRAYTSYFPISILCVKEKKEERVPVTALQVGDTIIIKNGEIIPADAILLSEEAHIDYSFVTGESQALTKKSGHMIYAGGRQVGASIRLQLIRKVEQSYLTQLWEDSSAKQHRQQVTRFADKLSKRFTTIILIVASIAGIGWWIATDAGNAINIFTAVLIVACPCALALSVPITLGNALRILGHNKLYLKNTDTIESLAQLRHIVFDKTGTITYKNTQLPHFFGIELSPQQMVLLRSLTHESNHPVSQSIYQWSGVGKRYPVSGFHEHLGKGIQATVQNIPVVLGNYEFVNELITAKSDFPEENLSTQSTTYLAIAGKYVGHFTLQDHYRAGWNTLIDNLGSKYDLTLLTGDHAHSQPYLKRFFPTNAELRFNQTPFDKRDYISSLQVSGKEVMMIGDGLNDAGALKQSNVGLAISEDVNNFSPACDGILDAGQFAAIDRFILYAQKSMKCVKWSYVLSLAYNIVGLSIAVQGLLSPVVAAILMPLSSITIVLFATTTTFLSAKALGLQTHAATNSQQL